MAKGSVRFKSLDIFRGLAILVMVIYHSTEFWLRGNDIWFPVLYVIIFDFFLAGFIFIAGVSLTLSYNAKQKRISEDPNYFPIYVKVDFVVKLFWLIFFAMIYNLIASTILLYGTTVWIWFVLLNLAFARLVCYPFLKYSPWVRVVMGVLFFIFADSIRIFLLSSADYSWIHYILFNGHHLETPFPHFGFFFIGSAIGQWISEIDVSKLKEKTDISIFIRNLLIIGLILIVFGIVMGTELYYEQDSFARGYTNYLNRNPLFDFKGILYFELRSSTPWSFYSLGQVLVILALILKLEILRPSTQEKKNKGGLILLGQFSFTIYMTHYLMFMTHIDPIPISIFFFIFPIILLLYYTLIWFWVNRGKGKYSIEWLMKYSIDSINNKIRMKREAIS
jgi:peptidoglycan/LPS O-acetylase OafA/YrhL